MRIGVRRHASCEEENQLPGEHIAGLLRMTKFAGSGNPLDVGTAAEPGPGPSDVNKEGVHGISIRMRSPATSMVTPW